MNLFNCLKEMVARDAQDLHLSADQPPAFRIDGQLHIADDLGPISQDELTQGKDQFLSEVQKEYFEEHLELDFSFEDADLGRFRGNMAKERRRLFMTFRRVTGIDLDIDSLGLPPVCKVLAARSSGMVIVTGLSGSGKSTTLAALIEYANQRFSRRIVTLEDPIEIVFHNKRSVITQRQIGEDAHSFASALRHVMRQNPDIVMIGEFRDAATIAAALTAGETGHLVFTTGHAPSAPQAIDRIINLFPAEQQTEVRAQLVVVLEAVIYQALLPKKGGNGRVLAAEVMLGTTAVRNLIRDRALHQLPGAIQLGQSQGMISFDDSVLALYRKGLITGEVALAACRDREQAERAISTPLAAQRINGHSHTNGVLSGGCPSPYRASLG